MLVLECRIFFKYDSSKNIKVTFENQHMVSQVLTKGLVLFNLFHPAHNICREIFVDILTCFKLSATNLKITQHRHALSRRSIKYAHYVPLKNIHTVHAFPAFGSVSTVKKRETIIAMSCPFQKNVSKKKRQEIMQNTNNRHPNNRHQSIHYILLIHIHMHLLKAIVLATLHQLPKSIHPQVTLILYQTVSLSQFTQSQHSKKAAFQMQLSAYLSPQSKTMRFRAPLKRF